MCLPRLGIAVPKYLEEKVYNEVDLPPGHKFNLYAKMWIITPQDKEKLFHIGTDIKEKKEKRDRDGNVIIRGRPGRNSGKLQALLNAAGDFPSNVTRIAKAIYQRQKILAENLHAYIIPIVFTAPLAIGMGNPHPVENGFSFLSPYGLPYVAGSGIKGVLRKAAKDCGYCDDKINSLFGKDDTNDSSRGALVFWDGFPQCRKMDYDVMTPHQSGYYVGNENPHDQGQPRPIPFLVVPANTNMNLIIQCDVNLLKNYEGKWQEDLNKIIIQASKWSGFGAKTSVGYGSFKIDETTETKPAVTSMSDEERQKISLSNELEQNLKDFNVQAKKNTFNRQKGEQKLLKPIDKICQISAKLRNDECKKALKEVFDYVDKDKKKSLIIKYNLNFI